MDDVNTENSEEEFDMSFSHPPPSKSSPKRLETPKRRKVLKSLSDDEMLPTAATGTEASTSNTNAVAKLPPHKISCSACGQSFTGKRLPLHKHPRLNVLVCTVSCFKA